MIFKHKLTLYSAYDRGTAIAFELLDYNFDINIFTLHNDLSYSLVLKWCTQIASGMNYLSAKSIVHNNLRLFFYEFFFD